MKKNKIIAKLSYIKHFLFDKKYILMEGFIIPLNKRTSQHILHNVPEPYMREFIKNNSMKDKIFIDIGSNLGFISITASKHFKKVYSFEPNNNYTGLFFEMMRVNKVDNVELKPYALSNKYSINNFIDNYGCSKLTNKKTKLKVKTKTLDEYKFKDVGIIKIDVEGHEFNVIKGAIETLKNNSVILIFERGESNDKDYAEIEKILRSLNYEKIKYIYSDEYWVSKRLKK